MFNYKKLVTVNLDHKMIKDLINQNQQVMILVFKD